MDTSHYLLSDVARILRLKPHRLNYALATRHVPEPALRVANKRVFLAEDVERLARHFQVTPDWPPAESPAEGQESRPFHAGLILTPPFWVQSAGVTGQAVLDGEGVVFCWAGDRAKALVVAGLLESAVRG